MSHDYLFIALLTLTAGTIVILVAQFVEQAGGDPEAKRLKRRMRDGASFTAASSLPHLSLMQSKEVHPLFRSKLGAKLHDNIICTFPDRDPHRVLTTIFVSGALLGAGAGVFFDSPSTGIITFLGVILACNMYMMAAAGRRQRLIDDQLPEALDFLARVLRAGHSLATGLLMASEELPEPLGSEFRRCYDRHSVGMAMEQAMREMARRLASPEFTFMVMAVTIQRQCGGDLAEILDNISTVIRARIRLRQHVHAITAEGRLVGNVLLILPIIFFLISYALNPAYTGVLLTTMEGRWLIYIGISMQICGWLAIRKIIAVKM